MIEIDVAIRRGQYGYYRAIHSQIFRVLLTLFNEAIVMIPLSCNNAQ